MKKILIIEDDKTKIERLKIFFKEKDLMIVESFQEGMLELKKKSDKYKFLILDMTIPLWKKGNNGLGGNYEQFGGEKILREMERRKIYLPTVLFTMFDVFPTKDGSIKFEELDELFKQKYPLFYLGAVFYNTNEDNWQVELKSLIEKIEG